MIAALPMYDRPEIGPAIDRFWALIRDRLRAAGLPAPAALTRGVPLWDIWQAPDLVLAQTCGLPYRARLHGRVTLVGTPDYGVEGCAPGFYRSVMVVRSDDPRAGLAAFDGARLAYSEALSQSGWGAAVALAAGQGLRWAAVGPTGGHAASAAWVAEGRADIAAIDAVTWRHLSRFDPVAPRLRVIAHSPPAPGLPLIAAQGAPQLALFAAVDGAIGALSPADRTDLSLRGLVALAPDDYLRLPLPPDPAAQLR